MALTEHEQEILSELEFSLFAQDPEFGERLSGSRIHAHHRGALRCGVTGFVVGSVSLVAFFASSIIFSFVSLAVMFFSGVTVLTSLGALRRLRKPHSKHPSVPIG
ncbi:MAG TPA: DUF3040 domain-containing protein [Acidimicrobiales bacterium]|nr:DUF3040 domain-containing protein [Acidimicrobiales bacterium]